MGDIDTSFRAGEQAWDGAGAVMGMMIDNHDVSRFASVSAGNAAGDAWTPAPQPLDPIVYAKQRVALATVLTLPGRAGRLLRRRGRARGQERSRLAPRDARRGRAARRRSSRRATSCARSGRARACSTALRRGALRTLVADAERFVFAREVEGDVRRRRDRRALAPALARRRGEAAGRRPERARRRRHRHARRRLERRAARCRPTPSASTSTSPPADPAARD